MRWNPTLDNFHRRKNLITEAVRCYLSQILFTKAEDWHLSDGLCPLVQSSNFDGGYWRCIWENADDWSADLGRPINARDAFNTWTRLQGLFTGQFSKKLCTKESSVRTLFLYSGHSARMKGGGREREREGGGGIFAFCVPGNRDKTGYKQA